MSGQHGGNYDPNNSGFYHASSTPAPLHHGGSFDPNNPATYQSGHGSPAQYGGQHGGHYDPNDPSGYQSRPSGRQQHSAYTTTQSSTSGTYQSRTNYPTTPPQPSPGQLPSYGSSPASTQSPYVQPLKPSYGSSGYQANSPNVGPAPMPQAPARQPGILVKNQATVVSQPTPVNEKSAEKEPKEFPSKLKSTGHVFSSQTNLRWRKPHHYQKPGYLYADQDNKYRHRDSAHRIKNLARGDKYLLPSTGYLRRLIVQSSDPLIEAQGNTTWCRTYIRKIAPWKVRIATWVIDYGNDPDSWEDWFVMLLRALPAAVAMSFFSWDMTNGVFQFQGYYSPVNYQYHGDAKVWSNTLEDRARSSSSTATYRLLRPRDLCFLRRDRGMEIRSVTQWEAEQGEDADLGYLFIAYSTEHFSHENEQDMRMLHEIAEGATRAEGLGAYWVACSCMRHAEEMESDVYRISDVVRGAQKMVIALPPSSKSQSSLLREWGTRMWTFPEILLSPGNAITLYTLDSLTNPSNPPQDVHKNQFAARAWPEDSDISRQLTDHYLGKTQLSRLELAVFGLTCLWRRRTKPYMDGDQAYALMGLLRGRPKVDKSDSAFQAFARLSLANDSDNLLERLFCTLPKIPKQPWHDMSDAYDCALWDISPYIQLAGICDNDTVVLDGARGATIQWDTFQCPWQSRGPSFKRAIAGFIMQNNNWFLVIASILFAQSGGTTVSNGFTTIRTGPNAGLIIAAIVLLAIYLYFWIMTPKLVRILYGGKFREIQAMLFGFEGYVNKAGVERAIFGANFGRFTWSANGSPLCRTVLNEFGERIGVDPVTSDPIVRQKVEAAKNARPGDMRVFTLVDTYNMELTLFEAARPPTALFLSAQEGGMQRAMACSYDWTMQTWYRETVLRMPTMTLNRMDRVPRFRFGMRREEVHSRVAVTAV